MSQSIPLYPPILVRRVEDGLQISNTYAFVLMNEQIDLYFRDVTLQTALEGIVSEQEIRSDDSRYYICNVLLRGEIIERFAIYDCVQGQWLCLSDGDVTWTSEESNEDIARFTSEDEAEEMIPDEDRESYVIQKRLYPKGV